MVVARALGFDHVSDDDFARVTIAQSFAHAPKLDPSGTSWLPFPFWLLGTVMAVFGRSLSVARVASIVVASAAATLPYVALRLTNVARARALFATALSLATPWAIWLGAATVPESFTASFTAAAAIVFGAQHGPSPRARVAFACALLAACLSRYEPWPVAAVLAIVVIVRGVRAPEHRSVALLCGALLAIGPLAWMAWNAHAHDGPLHFFRRVSNFKRAIGDGSTSTTEALLLYPVLIVKRRPEIVLASILAFRALSLPDVRRRWGVPLLAALAQLLFLAIGNARDGAPAHHPERALVGALLIFSFFAIDGALLGYRQLRPHPRNYVLVGALALLWPVMLVLGILAVPGNGTTEDRRAQIERGRALRDEDRRAITVTPCAYEHFALLAAFGAPERATMRPKTDAPLTAECPLVE